MIHWNSQQKTAFDEKRSCEIDLRKFYQYQCYRILMDGISSNKISFISFLIVFFYFLSSFKNNIFMLTKAIVRRLNYCIAEECAWYVRIRLCYCVRISSQQWNNQTVKTVKSTWINEWTTLYRMLHSICVDWDFKWIPHSCMCECELLFFKGRFYWWDEQNIRNKKNRSDHESHMKEESLILSKEIYSEFSIIIIIKHSKGFSFTLRDVEIYTKR